MFADFPLAGAPFSATGLEAVNVSVEITGVQAQGQVSAPTEVTGKAFIFPTGVIGVYLGEFV